MNATDRTPNTPNTVVVTRHNALIDYLIEQGLIPTTLVCICGRRPNGTEPSESCCREIANWRAVTDVPVLTHATADDVAGKHVFGVLPLHLAALCRTFTVIEVNAPPELRGTELSLEQLREYAGPATTYVVRTLRDVGRADEELSYYAHLGGNSHMDHALLRALGV